MNAMLDLKMSALSSAGEDQLRVLDLYSLIDVSGGCQLVFHKLGGMCGRKRWMGDFDTFSRLILPLFFKFITLCCFWSCFLSLFWLYVCAHVVRQPISFP